MSEPLPIPRFDDSLAVFVADLRSWVFPSQVKAAQYFHLTHSTISRYENNRLTPQLGYIAHLAHLFIDQSTTNQSAPGDRQQSEDAEVARARQMLLEQVNLAVRWCYPGERPFQDWNELIATGTAYLEDPSAERPMPRVAATQPVPPLADWDAAPDVSTFYGRQHELQTLERWLVDERCRMVSILGMGGMGKTTLVTRVAEQVQQKFDRLIWRSLRNAPLLHELLDALIPFIHDQPVDLAGASLDQKLSWLLDGLRTHRSLLVLDNWESLLSEGQESGHFRPGYEAYEHLLRAVGETRHQSCLLLTSRENPAIVAMLQGQSNAIQSLRLHGLGANETRQILADKGLTAPTPLWDALTARYSGNPLALKFAAETIQETFVGDIGLFLKADVAVVGEVRRVLDQQFSRLTNLEQEIVYWLTITLEPTTLAELQHLMIHSAALIELVDAVQSLRRRSLVEQSGRGFILQNVMLEYAADRLTAQVYSEAIGGPLSILHSHALILAQSKEYIRNSQIRLILHPICERLRHGLSQRQLAARFKELLDTLRMNPHALRSYAGGNLLNLMIQLEVELRGYNFANLAVWEAFLRSAALPGVNFEGADLSRSVFTDAFVGINSVAISPDCALLAVATEKEVHLWKVASGQLYAVFQGHTDLVWSVAFSPDGRSLASGSADRTVRIWDLETLHYRQILEGHTNWVWSVAFAPDGSALYSSSEDGSIRQWELASASCRHIFRHSETTLFALAIDRSGALLAGGGGDGDITVWRTDTAEVVQTLQSSQTQAPRSDGTAHPAAAEVLALAFSPDGTVLVSGGGDTIVRMWDVQTGRQIQMLAGHTRRVSAIEFVPDGKLLITGSYDGSLRLWESQSGQLRQILHRHSQAVRAIAMGQDGHTLVSGSYDQTVRIWELQNGQVLNTLQGYTQEVRAIALTADGRTLASASADQTVRIWDLAASKLRHTGHGHRRWVQTLAFSPDGSLLASGSYDRTVRIWDAATGEHLRTLEEPARWIWSVAFSPSGELLAAAAADGAISLWDTRTWRLLHRLHNHKRGVWSIAFDPTGTLLASASEDGSVRLWDAATGTEKALLGEHKATFYSTLFIQNGHTICAADESGAIWEWDVVSGAKQALLQPVHQAILALAYNPMRNWLAAGAGDGTICLLDLHTGQVERRLTGHSKAISSLLFDVSGQLISGSYDETIRFWDVEKGAQVKLLRVERPYEGMNISGASGLTTAQRTTLKALGALEI